MNIVLVSQEYPPETGHGGIATQTRLKARGLAALGHTVSVISHSTDGRRHEYRDGDVSVVRIPGVDDQLQINAVGVQWLSYATVVAAEIDAMRRRMPIDLIDFPEYGAEAYVHLLNQAPWNRVPTVIHLHGPLVMLAHTMGWPEIDSEFYRLGTLMEGGSLRMADGVISSSACSALWCARYYGERFASVPVIHTGVDTEHFSRRDVAKAERPTILFVGKLVANKGVELLLEAAIRLASKIPGLRLRVVGSGEDATIRRLRARAAAADARELLDLVGPVDRAELPEEYSRAHLFAAPSIYEGGPGFVYLEAMSCGLPVIACSGSGATEVVMHEENGLLVPPNDVDALESALRRLLSDAALRELLGGRGRTLAIEMNDSRGRILELEEFYRRVHAGVVAETDAGIAEELR
jgi:glycosyltransferase involved in cell wall biosynthesis